MSTYRTTGQPAGAKEPGPSFEVTWHLPGGPHSASLARALLREQLTSWHIEGEVADNAELLTSELVTNASRHAHVPADRRIGIRLARQGALLRLEVSDADSTPPPWPREASPDDEHGRGLAIVDTLAHRWGCDPRLHGIGKAVWAELVIQDPPGRT
ncbi:ATP-binding protein [Streptomyces sp. NPDC088725]|uniref:ATP-binding protein n=1 Tax=Streptomyces sp. NPDC088725 TaxID=3365873 RepID=UPI00381E9701